ncbi:hypothetical protein M7I_5813 [Glarea lozoyensis 74030]|uniref:Uncharacterized protein n=1 Tax=Glarea lozoyensis (strain ATCC 74030 / MF5533) TaxID=1104152 RepID=H0ESZ6_GLAL7|nr:hypothetical protein M7I_5813 [Glarea lozoyensis 74030]
MFADWVFHPQVGTNGIEGYDRGLIVELKVQASKTPSAFVQDFKVDIEKLKSPLKPEFQKFDRVAVAFAWDAPYLKLLDNVPNALKLFSLPLAGGDEVITATKTRAQTKAEKAAEKAAEE